MNANVKPKSMLAKAVEAKKHFRARVRSLDPLAGVYADNRYPSEIATTDTSVKCKLKVTS